MYFNEQITPLSAQFGGKTVELDINVFFQVNMRSSIQPSKNSGYDHKLKPPPLKFYLLVNEQIPLWSAWFHSVSVKLCLFEFLTRSQLLDFLFDIFFGCFFRKVPAGAPNFNDHATWRAYETFQNSRNFNEHVHIEDSMPRGGHTHFQKTPVS